MARQPKQPIDPNHPDRATVAIAVSSPAWGGLKSQVLETVGQAEIQASTTRSIQVVAALREIIIEHGESMTAPGKFGPVEISDSERADLLLRTAKTLMDLEIGQGLFDMKSGVWLKTVVRCMQQAQKRYGMSPEEGARFLGLFWSELQQEGLEPPGSTP